MDLCAIISTGKSLTLSLAAYLLCLFPDEDDFITEGEFAMLQQGLAAVDVNALPCVQGTNSRRDPRNEDPLVAVSADAETTIFTDYDYAYDLIQQLSGSTSSMSKFSCTEDPSKASFWLKTAHTTDFLSVPSHIRVSSFPYEGGFVRKDLLPLTIRRHCYHHQSSYLKLTDGIINTQRSHAPSWWLPCFDLSTEFHLFREEYERRKCQGETNSWILKPSQGTRAQGHVIITPMMGLQNVTTLAPQLPISLIRQMQSVCDERKCKKTGNRDDEAAATAATADKVVEEEAKAETGKANMDGEKVAQLFVTHPLLVHGRKFDIRVYVFVRSFQPFEAYMHTLHYARLANKPYHLTSPDAWIDPEVAITVSAYNPDPSIAAKQSRLTSAALGQQLELEHPGLRYDDMVKSMRAMLQELFEGLSSSVGYWPRSSAYYALDLLYDNSANVNASATTNAHTITPHTNIDTTNSNNSNNSDGNISDNSSSDSNNSHFHPPVPKLVEINYMGDWKALKKITVLENEERRARQSPKSDIDSSLDAVTNPVSAPNPDSRPTTNPAGERDEVMLEWVEDLLTVLSTNSAPHPDRCIPLHHKEP